MIVHVVGARPNLMKAAAVLKWADGYLLHTGQHWHPDLHLDGLEPDESLDLRTSNIPELTAALLKRLFEIDPEKVVVYGDVNSTLAAGVAAAHLGYPVAHVEAGLRCGDLSMPEEVNRRAVDAISTQWFTTEPSAVANLSGLGHFVGNPMIDTLAASGIKRGSGGPGIVTLHRPFNVDDPVRAGRIAVALNRIALNHKLLAVLHPRSQHLAAKLAFPTVPALPYYDFIQQLADAPFVITDSGGVQEEATWLKVPCLTVRPSTERPVTVQVGGNRLVEPDHINVDDLPEAHTTPELWDGHAGQRIAELL